MSEGTTRSRQQQSKAVYNKTKNLTTNTIENILPYLSSSKDLIDNFVNFFEEKINKITSQLGHEVTFNTSTRKCNILSKF